MLNCSPHLPDKTWSWCLPPGGNHNETGGDGYKCDGGGDGDGDGDGGDGGDGVGPLVVVMMTMIAMILDKIVPDQYDNENED